MTGGKLIGIAIPAVLSTRLLAHEAVVRRRRGCRSKLCIAFESRRRCGVDTVVNTPFVVPTVFDTPLAYAAVVMRSCQARRVSVGVL
jgi:hypothetical protein